MPAQFSGRIYVYPAQGTSVSIQAARVSLTVDARLEGYDYEVWHITIEAPWLVVLTFIPWLGLDGAGYVVKLEDEYYVAGRAQALEDLPDTKDLHKVPLAGDLAPGVVWIEEEDDAYLQKYVHGSLSELLPSNVTLDDFPPEIGDPERCVGIYKSRTGIIWSDTKAVLGENLGLILRNSVIGRFFLQSVTLAGEDQVAHGAEGSTPQDEP